MDAKINFAEINKTILPKVTKQNVTRYSPE